MTEDPDFVRRLQDDLDLLARSAPLRNVDVPVHPPRHPYRRGAGAAGSALVLLVAAVAAFLAFRAPPHTTVLTRPGGSAPTSGATASRHPPVPPRPAQPRADGPVGPACPGAGAGTTCARRWTEACVAVERPPVGTGAMVLRDSASDPAGLVLLLTSRSGWQTCSVPPGGHTPTLGLSYQTWASSEGWGAPPHQVVADPPSTPDRYLSTEVEVQSDGTGVVTGGWQELVIGRAALPVRRVTIHQFGTTTAATVRNGVYVAEAILDAAPSYGPGSIPVLGYDARGRVVYRSTPFSTGHPPCWNTPSGAPLTPRLPHQVCRIGIPWA